MKRSLIYNYWLIIISWCLFLNDLALLAMLVTIAACVMLIRINRRINYWRVCFVAIVSYVTISFFLSTSNIPYFFSKLYLFLATISLDLALTNERLYLFKSKYIKPFLVAMLMSLSVLSIIAFVLPGDLYTLFTKTSLYIMIFIIFLPHLATVSLCLANKYIKDKIKNTKNTKHLEMSHQRI